MPLPNHFDVVQRLNTQFPTFLITNTHESCGKFTELVVVELARLFPFEGWGHVGKSGGQTQYNGHAVDACMSKLDLSLAVDIIVNSAANPQPPGKPPQPGSPSWGEVTSNGQPWKPPIPVNGGGVGDCNCKEEIANLQNQINDLKNELQSVKNSSLQYESEVALRMSEGLVVNFENGGGTQPNVEQKLQTRTGVGAHEIVRLVRP